MSPKYSTHSVLGDTIDTSELEDGSVTAAKIATGVVALQLVETITLAAAANTLDFTSLDGDSDGYYLLIYNIDHSAASTDVYLEINGNATATDYYSQLLAAISTSISGNRVNSGLLEQMQNGIAGIGQLIIYRDRDGYGIANGLCMQERGNSCGFRQRLVSTKAAISNITQLTIKTANNMNINSTASLYKISRG